MQSIFPSFVSFFLSFVMAAFLLPGALDSREPVAYYAVGSCHHQNRIAPVFYTIGHSQPHAFLFIGDIVYNDTYNVEQMRKNYRLLQEKESFQFLKSRSKVYYIWDDHDYGWNDAGGEFPYKKESLQVFLDMQGVSQDSSRRSRKGAYFSVLEKKGDFTVQLIFLDARYNRSPLEKRFWFLPGYAVSRDPYKTIAGNEQWEWLESELKKKADVRLIASGIQVLNVDSHFEKWYNIAPERDRLFSLIEKTGAGGVIFLSGDRHFAEISHLPAGESSARIPYDFYELTASGLTHSWPDGANTENRYRLGRAYGEINFGGIEIFYDGNEPLIRLSTRTLTGAIFEEVVIPLSRLQPQTRSQKG